MQKETNQAHKIRFLVLNEQFLSYTGSGFKGFSNTLPPQIPMSSPRDKIASGLPAIAD